MVALDNQTLVAAADTDAIRAQGHIKVEEAAPNLETDEEKLFDGEKVYIEGHEDDVIEMSPEEVTIRRYCTWTAQSIPPDLWSFIIGQMRERTPEEWRDILANQYDYYEDDQNVPLDYKEYLAKLVDGTPLDGLTEKEQAIITSFEAYMIYDWSIYPEVRTISMPYGFEEDEDYENFRTYFIGLVFAMAGCALDTFFAQRQPAITLSGGAIQVLMAATGKLFSIMPRMTIPFFKKRLVINSGEPFSYRELMFATVIIAVSLGCSWAQDIAIVLSNRHFFNIPEASSFGFVILVQLAFALTGFGLAGVMRVWFVYPPKMVYYDSLYLNAMARSLTVPEPRESVNKWKLKTTEFFWLFGWLNFAYYWVTNLGFQALSQFGWGTWIAPNNVNVNVITGPISGLGFLPFQTWDPNVIGLGCLLTPFRWLVQYYTGLLFTMFAVIVIYYTNVRETSYLPINVATLYDNTGNAYNVSNVLTDRQFDPIKYQNYSLPYFSAGYLVNYATNFAYMPAVTVWVFLYYHKLITGNFKAFLRGILSPMKMLDSFDDRFSRDMRRHPECPEYWYFALLCLGFALTIACVEHYGFVDTPVWTLFVGAAICWVLLLAANTLRATTTYFFSPNDLLAIIFGYSLEHNGPGLLFASYFSFCFTEQTDNWVDNQKIAHYSGIKPRAMFRGQFLSTVLTSFVMAGIISWQADSSMGHPETFCTYQDESKFRCLPAKSYFNTSVVWGTIGPRIVFKGLYPSIKWVFLLGALFPIPMYICKVVLPKFAKRYPEGSRARNILSFRWLQGINELVILNSGRVWGSYNWYYYMPDFIFGFFWQHILKNRFPRFWAKYTLTLYNAVSVGIAFAALFCFFATQYKNQVFPEWWGNTASDNTLDVLGAAIRFNVTLREPRGYFGPDKGTFPL